jgi:hypothetical protein
VTLDRFDVQFVLDGTDITDHVDVKAFPFEINSGLNDELDTANLTIKRVGELSATILRGWKDLVIYNGTDKAFGGYLLTKDKVPSENASDNDYSCQFADYSAYFEKVLVTGEYIGQTDKAIIAAIFSGSGDLTEYDAVTHVNVIQTIDRVIFNRKSVRDMLAWLVDQTGGYWRVDSEKKLHYFSTEDYLAPFNVTSNPADTTRECVENVSVNEDAAGVVNIVEVIGGNALGGDDTFQYTKNGYGQTLQLTDRLAPWNGESKIVVRRNDGGSTTNLLANPSFETNITDGWTQYQAGTGAAWAQDSSKYSKGSKSAKITAGTAVSMLRGASITLSPGEPLSAQAMCWADTLAMANLVIYDVGSSVVLKEISNRKTSTWEQLACTYINTSAASMTVRVELRNNAVDSAKIVYFDGAQAEKIAWPTAYCDGTLGTGYAWTGTANNSTSTRVNMPVWTTMTVKNGNSETLATVTDVLYYDLTGSLEQELYWPTLANAIEIDGQSQRPVRIEVRNFASYQYYGKWFKKSITDSTIIDLAVGRMRGMTELARYAYETETAKYDVRRSGLQAGQTQNVYLPHRGLNGTFLIRSVNYKIADGGYMVGTVSVGAIDNDLVKVLLNLKRSSAGEVTFSAEERLEYSLFQAEEVTISEGTDTITSHEGIYKWDDGCKWDFAKWG